MGSLKTQRLRSGMAWVLSGGLVFLMIAVGAAVAGGRGRGGDGDAGRSFRGATTDNSASRQVAPAQPQRESRRWSAVPGSQAGETRPQPPQTSPWKPASQWGRFGRMRDSPLVNPTRCSPRHRRRGSATAWNRPTSPPRPAGSSKVVCRPPCLLRLGPASKRRWDSDAVSRR